MDITVRSGILTHVGQRRKINEDSVAFFEPTDTKKIKESGYLYVVADGVGGADKGDYASKYASQKVLYEYYQHNSILPKDRLKTAILTANSDIYQYSFKGNDGKRMATTLVAAAVVNGRVVVANVGDSRAYIIRNGVITQITQDHSVVAQLVKDGLMTSEEAETSEIKNKITRSVGGKQDVSVDIFEVELLPGDRILLCSDGLTRYFKDDELLFVATKGNSKTITPVLVDKANERGGADNISVILIEYDYREKLVEVPAISDMVSRETAPVFYDEITGEEISPSVSGRESVVYRRKKTSSQSFNPAVFPWLKLLYTSLAVFLFFLVIGAGIRYLLGDSLEPQQSSSNASIVLVEPREEDDDLTDYKFIETPTPKTPETGVIQPVSENSPTVNNPGNEPTQSGIQILYCRYQVKPKETFSGILKLMNLDNVTVEFFKQTCRPENLCKNIDIIHTDNHFIFELNEQLTSEICENAGGKLTNENN